MTRARPSEGVGEADLGWLDLIVILSWRHVCTDLWSASRCDQSQLESRHSAQILVHALQVLLFSSGLSHIVLLTTTRCSHPFVCARRHNKEHVGAAARVVGTDPQGRGAGAEGVQLAHEVQGAHIRQRSIGPTTL